MTSLVRICSGSILISVWGYYNGVYNRYYIINQFNEPEAIILFGSYYKAENIKKSDIDLLVISPIKKELKLNEVLEKIK